MRKLTIIVLIIFYSCQLNRTDNTILGYWSTEDESMSLIIEQDSISDTEYFGTFRYVMTKDSIEVFYDEPVKLKYTLTDNKELTLAGQDIKRTYYRVK